MRLTAAAVALGTALLTGCGAAEAEAPSTSLPSATSAAPATEALPVVGPADFPVPPEARTQDAAGAEAFLRYWIELLNRQRAVPDGQPLRELAPDCQNCQRIAQNYDEAAAAGERYKGGEIELASVAEPTIDGNEASIAFLARQEAVQRLDTAGNPVDAGQELADRLSSGIALVWSTRERAWLVTGFDLG